MIRCDVSGIKRCADKMGQAAGAGALKGFAGELAEELKVFASARTPVDTGRLQGGWEVEKEIDGSSARVSNSVEYASFVEYGHRTRTGRGFVAGRGMLRMAREDLEGELPRLALEHLEQIIEGCF